MRLHFSVYTYKSRNNTVIRNLLALCHYFAFRYPAGPRTTRLHDDLQIPISYEVKAAS